MVIKCFLIDDDLDDQEIFLMAIKRLDANVECQVASDGTTGLDRLSNDDSYVPSFIFIDINMHKMNGIECLQEIRKLDHLRNSQIIMVSTSSEPRIVQQCLTLGADAFLPKPPAFGTLVSALNNILYRQKSL